MSVLALFLGVLLIAGIALIWEARTGRLEPQRPFTATLRVALFFAAAVAGGALLLRSASASPALALALVPVTGLSLFRLTMLSRPIISRGSGRRLVSLLVLATALVAGLTISLSMLPQSLDQRVFIEQIFHRDAPSDTRSIDPAARRSSRA
jgi:hypothetical protein